MGSDIDAVLAVIVGKVLPLAKVIIALDPTLTLPADPALDVTANCTMAYPLAGAV